MHSSVHLHMNKSTHLHTAGLSDTNDPGKEGGQQRGKKQSKSRVEHEREEGGGVDWFKGMEAVGGGSGALCCFQTVPV